ncbi:AraC family transcriptional regulator [Maribacter sp. 2307ULW6-5]|uniref:AraC family transcriptional regulator n=1 Tax=Maribacter sp. 2307ULW6-5 TaxID=3386275 RepID=UPI0039BD61D0
MKPSFYKIIFDRETPFRCTYIDEPYFDHPLHFHPEIELTLIMESEGVRYIGDNTSNFRKGDLILIGSNLPHMWSNQKETNRTSRSRRMTLQFPKDLMNHLFGAAEELEPVAKLFKLAKRGISYPGKTSKEIAPLLKEINDTKGLSRWILVFELLLKLTKAQDYKILASESYQADLTNQDVDRLNRIFQYIRNNIEKRITLDEVADIACLTKPSFCRLFKNKTGTSFMHFLNEYRINNAKRIMLENKEIPIASVAQKSGFNTIQHFNAKFKKHNKGMTPSDYLKKMNAS